MKITLTGLIKTVTLLALPALLQAHEHGGDYSENADAKTAPAISMGNGEKNWIEFDRMTRAGNTLTIPKIMIEKDGWLVAHPFKDGKPNGQIYVGASFLKAGENNHVDLKVYRELEPGTPLVVMLHFDENQNGAFDFLFVDERSVLDKAVFEGATMVSHIIQAP